MALRLGEVMTVYIDYKESGNTVVSFVVRASSLIAAKNRAKAIAVAYAIDNGGTYSVNTINDTQP